MTGRMLSLKELHPCRPPPKRAMRRYVEAEWQCECGQMWDWGQGLDLEWSRRPDWVTHWGNRA